MEAYINEPAVNKSVRQITYLATTITEDNKIAWLLKAISFLDLTTLNNDDTSSTIEQLCENVNWNMELLFFTLMWIKSIIDQLINITGCKPYKGASIWME